MDEFLMEDHADAVIAEIGEYLDVESGLLRSEHELHEKLLSFDLILGHLDERIPSKAGHLHSLIKDISDALEEITGELERWGAQNARLQREEEALLTHLKEDVGHREWRAARSAVDAESDDERKGLRLQDRELRWLHNRFRALRELMKEKNLVKALEQDHLSKEEYEQTHDYYFGRIYQVIRTYERVFLHLFEKEERLAKHLRSGK